MQALAEDPHVEAADRVARGAAFLDSVLPGWGANVDPDDLDLFDGQRCVLGQLGTNDGRLSGIQAGFGYSTYYNVLAHLHPTWSEGVRDNWAITHGFLKEAKGNYFDGVTYEYLVPAWRVVINQRVDEAFSDAYEARGIFAEPDPE